MNISNYPLVLVRWHDSASGTGWRDVETITDEAEAEYLCATVGWLVLRQARQITVVQSLGGLGACPSVRKQADARMSIPTACVDSIQMLRTHGMFELPRFRRL